MIDEELTEEELQIEENKVIQVIQYGLDDYYIGLINLDQANSNDFAVIVDNPMSLQYNDDDINGFRLFESALIDPMSCINVNKQHLISLFSPSKILLDLYIDSITHIIEREENSDDELYRGYDQSEEQQDPLSNFYKVNTKQ